MNGNCERCGIYVPDGGGRFCAKHGGIKVEGSTWKEPCLNPSHEPPSHMYIEPGKQYQHACPGCGYQVTIRPPMIHW